MPNMAHVAQQSDYMPLNVIPRPTLSRSQERAIASVSWHLRGWKGLQSGLNRQSRSYYGVAGDERGQNSR